MIKAAIFDLDDLMIDSLDLHIRVDDATFKELGYDLKTIPYAISKKFVGKRVLDNIISIKNYFHILDEVITVEEIFKRRNNLLFEYLKIKGNIKPMKGLYKSLEFIKKKNLLLALVTSGTKEYLNIILKNLDLESVFNLKITGDLVKNGKPNPECYLLAKKLLDIGDFEGFVLEDSETGIESAIKAKLIAIGVPSPRLSQK